MILHIGPNNHLHRNRGVETGLSGTVYKKHDCYLDPHTQTGLHVSLAYFRLNSHQFHHFLPMTLTFLKHLKLFCSIAIILD